MRESSLVHVPREELSRLYNERRLTMKEIGELFDVSDEVVRYRLCGLLEPHLKHSKRCHDMHSVRQNVIERGI
jgi:hypothetical protein